MDTFRQDIRLALKGFARNRGFTAAVILTMALGIGANTAIFSVVHGVLLRPLPYKQGDQLVILRQQRPLAGIQAQGFSPPEMEDYRQQSKTLEAIVEYHNMWFVLLGRGEPERVQTGVVSWNYFDLFGVKPVAGRIVPRGRRQAGCRCGARAEPQVLAEPLRRRSARHRAGVPDERPAPHGNWRAAAYSAIPGRERRLHAGLGLSVPLRRGGPHGTETRAWCRRSAGCVAASATEVEPSGRCARGVAPAAGVSGELSGQRRLHGDALSLRNELTRGFRPTLAILLGAAGFLLLIVCASVANLMLARLLKREREMAIRMSLGAGRWRLVRQLLTESTLLAIAGAVVGLGDRAGDDGSAGIAGRSVHHAIGGDLA